MIRLVNPSSGGETWVHESRLDEYLARGFKFYEPPPPVSPPPPPVKAGRNPAPRTPAKKSKAR